MGKDESKNDIVKKESYIVRYDILPPEWKMTNVGLKAVMDMQKAINSVGTHGILAGIPIICKGKQCPYIDTCAMETLNIDVNTLVGNRCPVEVAEIINLFEKYCAQFNIDENTEDMVMLGLIKELIDYEIQIRRADHKMASQGDFLEDIVVGVTERGHPIVNKEIAKPIDYKERAIKKKHEILQLLNSTPKDKAANTKKVEVSMDPSTYAAQLLAKAKDLDDVKIIDIEVQDDNTE